MGDATLLMQPYSRGQDFAPEQSPTSRARNGEGG
jgi:hypothetical protein